MADTPPYGKPGFDINGDQRGRIIGSLTSILVITITCVALRLISRKLSRAGFWWDDYYCIISMLFSNVCAIILFIDLRYGYGRHIYIWTPEEKGIAIARSWLRNLYVFELFFHTATTLSKFAILAFYYRIFAVPKFRRILIWVAVLCVVYMVGVDLAIIFQCQPIHYAWDRVKDPEGLYGHCYNVDAFFKGSGSVNVFLNTLIFVLPVPLLLRLRTTTRQQIILFAIFTLAGFVVLVSIIWIVVLSCIEQNDVTWNYINAGIWSALEPNMAVVCACIPSLRPLFTIASQGVFNHPLVRSRLRSNKGSGLSSKLTWGSSSRGKASDGNFSHLDEPEDLRPLGYDAAVRGGSVNGPQGMEEGVELPQHGINVRTEIEVESSERLDYNDRLY